MEIKEVKIQKGRKEGWYAGKHNGKPTFVIRGIDCGPYENRSVWAEVYEKEKIAIAVPFIYKKDSKNLGEVFFTKEYLNGKKQEFKPSTKPRKVFITYFPYGEVCISYSFVNPITGEEDSEVFDLVDGNKNIVNKIKAVEKFKDVPGAEEILHWYEDFCNKLNFIAENKKVIEKYFRAKELENALWSKLKTIYSADGNERVDFSCGVKFLRKEERTVVETDSTTLLGNAGKTHQYKVKKTGWWVISKEDISSEDLREKLETPEVKKLMRNAKRYLTIERYISHFWDMYGEYIKLWMKIEDYSPQELQRNLPPEFWKFWSKQ